MRSLYLWLQDETNFFGVSILAVTILAHADNRGFLKAKCNTGEGWNLMDLVDKVSGVQSLLGKPKLFFINACIDGKQL